MTISKLVMCLAALLGGSGLLSCDAGPTSVAGEVGRVDISPRAPSLEAGATQQLQVSLLDAAGNPMGERPVIWDTQNEAVARVSQSGVVTGVAPGEAQISASSGGRDGYATVRVLASGVATVAVSPPSPGIGVGGTVQLQATPRNSAGETLNGEAVNWTSRNASVARVEQNGVVTGLLPGSVEIVATIDGKTGSAAVTVTAAPAGVLAVASLLKVSGDGVRDKKVGDRVRLVVRALDGLGMPVAGATVAWATPAGSVAPVTSVTNGSGEATTEWTLGKKGDNTATATAHGRTASFSATANR